MDLNDRSELRITSLENKRLQRLLQQKIDSQTKPFGALGILEDIALQTGLVFKTTSPKIKKPSLLVFAADHGVVESGVSPFSREVTHQVVLNFLHEGAAINVFAKNTNLRLRLIDVGVDHAFEGTLTYWIHHGTKVQSRKIAMGTQNFVQYPAMSTADAERAIDTGKKLVEQEKEEGCNTIGFGDIAVGNFSSGLAISCAILEKDAEEVLKIDPDNIPLSQRKIVEVVNKALRTHPKTHDPLMILTLYGGFEIAAMVGAILRAAELHMLVLIDGYIGSVALMVAQRINPHVADYCIICQHSGEDAHQTVLDHLKKKPLLNLKVNIGEGCGVALALPIIKNAVDFLNGMTAFNDVISPKPES